MKQGKSHMFIQEGEISSIDEQNVGIPATANSSTTTIINCSRCGAQMRNDARYCMKCGNLNYAHQENKSMQQYATDNSKYNSYNSGVGATNINTIGNTKSHPFLVCTITNIIILLLPLLLVVIRRYNAGDAEMTWVLVLIFGVMAFVFYSYQRLLIKAGEAWWSVFIPVYDVYVFYKVSLGSGWYFLLALIPVVGTVVNLIALYQLAKRFNKSGLLMMFFPFIIISIIAFDQNNMGEDSGEISLKNYKASVIDENGITKMEKRYRLKKLLLTVVLVIVLGYIIYWGRDYIKMIYEFILEQYEATKKILIK